MLGQRWKRVRMGKARAGVGGDFGFFSAPRVRIAWYMAVGYLVGYFSLLTKISFFLNANSCDVVVVMVFGSRSVFVHFTVVL